MRPIRLFDYESCNVRPRHSNRNHRMQWVQKTETYVLGAFNSTNVFRHRESIISSIGDITRRIRSAKRWHRTARPAPPATIFLPRYKYRFFDEFHSIFRLTLRRECAHDCYNFALETCIQSFSYIMVSYNLTYWYEFTSQGFDRPANLSRHQSYLSQPTRFFPDRTYFSTYP